VSRALISLLSVAAGLIVGVVAVTALSSSDETPAGVAPDQQAGVQPAPVQDPAELLAGFNLTAYTTDGYAGAEVEQELARLKDLGSNTVVFVPTWYMKRADSNRIEADFSKTPDDAGLSQAISSARQDGLKVMVKPHVDVLDGTFRGEIQPSDKTAWFESYDRFIGHYADLTSGGGAELFSVGTELESLSTETDSWGSVIESVRARFGGELTYSANWDEVWQVQFWDRLDLIGVDAYFPLSQEGEVPTPGSLASAWQPNVDGLADLSGQWGLPVLLTEIGYPSQVGSTSHPWEVRAGDPPDQELQAMAYQAAFDAFEDKPWLRGILWWSWRADAKPEEQADIGYTPEGKKAETVFSAAQAGS
jgi:hypothetical protein